MLIMTVDPDKAIKETSYLVMQLCGHRGARPAIHASSPSEWCQSASDWS